MKMMRFLIVLMCSCTLLAGCKPAAKDKPDNMLSLSVKIDGIPNTDSFFNSRNGVGINAITDAGVANVYVKAFHGDTRVHIPDNAAGGVASLGRNIANNNWYGVVSFPDPSGSVTFLAYAVDSSGQHLYSGAKIYSSIQEVTQPIQITVAGNTNPNVATPNGGYVIATTADASLGWGPGGGWVFYDKGFYADGWRYMEAAPASWYSIISMSDPKEFWWVGPPGPSLVVPGTLIDIGSGKSNTISIVNYATTNICTAPAAQLCKSLNFNAYSDWFLPSSSELTEMYTNLIIGKGLGNFTLDDYYWSSRDVSKLSGINATAIYFSDGVLGPMSKTSERFVRPVRQF